MTYDDLMRAKEAPDAIRKALNESLGKHYARLDGEYTLHIGYGTRDARGFALSEEAMAAMRPLLPILFPSTGESTTAPPPRCEWRAPRHGEWFHDGEMWIEAWRDKGVRLGTTPRWVCPSATSCPDFPPPNGGRAPDSHDDCNTVEVSPSPKYPTDSHGFQWREPGHHTDARWWFDEDDREWSRALVNYEYSDPHWFSPAGPKPTSPPDNDGAPPTTSSVPISPGLVDPPPSPASGVKEIGAGFRLEDRDGILTVWRRGTMLWRCSNPQDASHLRDLASAAVRGFAATDLEPLYAELMAACDHILDREQVHGPALSALYPIEPSSIRNNLADALCRIRNAVRALRDRLASRGNGGA